MRHGLRRDGEETAVAEVLHGAAAGCDARALVVAENEEFVLDDWTANGAAELILLEDVARGARFIVLPAVRIQLVILKNFEDYAVNLVGARFQVDVHNAAGGAAVFSVIAIRQDLHGADGFDRGVNDERLLVDEVDNVDVVVNAIQQEVVFTRGTDAICGEVAAKRAAGAGFGRQDPGRQAREKRERALAAEGQLRHLLRIQIGALLGGFRLEQWRGGGNFDGLRCVADLQRDVDAVSSAGADDNSFLLGFLETRGFHVNGVCAGFQKRADVSAGCVRLNLIRQASGIFGNNYLCIWHGGALGVANSAGDGAEIALSI